MNGEWNKGAFKISNSLTMKNERLLLYAVNSLTPTPSCYMYKYDDLVGFIYVKMCGKYAKSFGRHAK